MGTTHVNYMQVYKSKPGTSMVTITLINPGDFILDGKREQVRSITYGTVGTDGPTESFTVCSNGEYVPALVETQYDPVTLSSGGAVNPPSYCHIYFKVNRDRWYWSTDPQTSDNPTIFVLGQGEHTHPEIDFQRPTQQNPNALPSLLPCLNSEMVFLLDKNANGNMLFRGNEPLCPGMKNQHVDFTTLHSAMKSAYVFQHKGDPSGFPEMGSYILRDIAFLDPAPDDEGPILDAEIASFGATKSSQVNQEWYPPLSELAPLPNTTMIGQVANWNVEPSVNQGPALALDITCVDKLQAWMNTVLQYPSGTNVPTIYYIHCSSGHDRTGMMASAYLIKQHAMHASQAFIMGTTLNKLPQPPAGNLVPDCYNVETTTIDKQRSRCFLAGNGSISTYNNTVVDIYNRINPKAPITSLSATALSGDPAINPNPPPALPTPFVYPNYPWE